MSKDSPIPIHGDAVTFNLNIVLRDSIMHSQYFRELLNKRTFQEVPLSHADDGRGRLHGQARGALGAAGQLAALHDVLLSLPHAAYAAVGYPQLTQKTRWSA